MTSLINDRGVAPINHTWDRQRLDRAADRQTATRLRS
jgi:hypothetical protein